MCELPMHDPFYEDYSEFDKQIDDFKQSLIKTVKQDYIAEMKKLRKEHYNDAIAIACLNNIDRKGLISFKLKTNLVIYKKCVSDGDYQLYKGIRSEQKIPSGKICGFRKFDKVKYLGKEYFIKGRMSTGYAVLMYVCGNKVDLKPTPKFTKMKRIGARKSWIIHTTSSIA